MAGGTDPERTDRDHSPMNEIDEMFEPTSPPARWSVLENPIGSHHGARVDAPGEQVDTVMTGPNWWLERIVSKGDVTPEGEWFDQDTDEWVVVVQGAAVLSVETDGDKQRWSLEPGDSCFLPAHCRHRVEWTTLDEPTVWLAVHRR